MKCHACFTNQEWETVGVRFEPNLMFRGELPSFKGRFPHLSTRGFLLLDQIAT